MSGVHTVRCGPYTHQKEMGTPVEIRDAEKMVVVDTDSRGRVSLGPEYSDRKVRVAFEVLEGDKEDTQA